MYILSFFGGLLCIRPWPALLVREDTDKGDEKWKRGMVFFQ